MNCEEIEKDPTSLSVSQPPQGHFITPTNHPSSRIEINYEQVKCILLAKLQAAVTTLQETNSTEIIIHQCQLIKACAEALLAVSRLTVEDVTTVQ